MGGESLRLQFGAGLKSGSELTDPREREAGSPATLLAVPVLLILTAALASAQASYTFSPQGAEVSVAQVGQNIPGEQVLAAIACGATSYSGGVIWQQAIAQGYQPISNLLVPSVTSKVAAKNIWSKLALGAGYATIITAEIASGGTFAIGTKALAGVLFTHGALDQFTPLLQSAAPNPAALLSAQVDPSQNYNAAASGCYQGLMLARYVGATPLQARPPQRDVQPPAVPPIHTGALPEDDSRETVAGALVAMSAAQQDMGIIPTNWQLDRGDSAEETTLAALKGGWGQQNESLLAKR